MDKGINSRIAASLAEAAGISRHAALESLSPPQGKFGDLASTAAFAIAKEKKANPVEIASKICAKIKLPEGVTEARPAGPYVNFIFSDPQWAHFAREFQGAEFARGKRVPGKALIEFPSVNPNKPWHIGHLRNALLGDSVARIMEFAGRHVEREDYIDDLGLQVAQSVWGQKNLPRPQEGKFDHMLGKQYVEVAKRLSDPQVEAQVRQIIHDLEAGTSIAAKDARAMVEKCVAAQYETAFAFGIYHNVLVFESDIVRTIFNEGMDAIKSSGAARLESEGKNAGCYVVPLSGEEGFEGMENADKVLIRSDGTATYTGKDAVFQLWKFGKLSGNFKFVPFLKQPNGGIAYMSTQIGRPEKFGGANTVINVIGMEQAYPQKVLKVVLSRLGFKDEAENSTHLSYEHAVLPQGRFSGRDGTWMAQSEGGIGFTADELLSEATSRAMEKIKGEFSGAEKSSIARAVAIGAIRFSFLRQSADKKIVFDYDSALSFEGDSGPYVQYAYARACRIIEKANGMGIVPGGQLPEGYAFSDSEKALLRHISLLPSLVEKCAASHQAHPMAEFTLELAGRFSKFYASTPVLSDEASGAQKQARLAQVAAAKNALGLSMSLLGIPAIERM